MSSVDRKLTIARRRSHHTQISPLRWESYPPSKKASGVSVRPLPFATPAVYCSPKVCLPCWQLLLEARRRRLALWPEVAQVPGKFCIDEGVCTRSTVVLFFRGCKRSRRLHPVHTTHTRTAQAAQSFSVGGTTSRLRRRVQPLGHMHALIDSPLGGAGPRESAVCGCFRQGRCRVCPGLPTSTRTPD